MLHEVVVGNARCHDGTLRVVAARVGVVGRLLALGGEDRLCRYQFGVVLLRESGQEDEVLHILRQREFVLPRQFIGGLHHGAGVRHAGGNAQENGCAQLLAERESVARHLVSLLLVRGLEAGNHGELRIEARVLFVLGRVHARVVGCKDYQSAVHARDSRVHKRVGAHIHTHMFHADQCAFSHVRHAERAFHGGLLVGCPAAEDGLGCGTLRFMELDVLGNLR